jgi:outer membrane protein W
MNRANPVPPDSKADKNKIETERSANVSGASVKNRAVNRAAVSRVAVNKVAVNRVAVSKADDKTGSLNQQAVGGNSRRFFVFDTFRLIGRTKCFQYEFIAQVKAV